MSACIPFAFIRHSTTTFVHIAHARVCPRSVFGIRRSLSPIFALVVAIANALFAFVRYFRIHCRIELEKEAKHNWSVVCFLHCLLAHTQTLTQRDACSRASAFARCTHQFNVVAMTPHFCFHVRLFMLTFRILSLVSFACVQRLTCVSSSILSLQWENMNRKLCSQTVDYPTKKHFAFAKPISIDDDDVRDGGRRDTMNKTEHATKSTTRIFVSCVYVWTLSNTQTQWFRCNGLNTLTKNILSHR